MTAQDRAIFLGELAALGLLPLALAKVPPAVRSELVRLAGEVMS